MRLIALFLIGLVVGAAGTLIAINAMDRHTPWSKATWRKDPDVAWQRAQSVAPATANCPTCGSA